MVNSLKAGPGWVPRDCKRPFHELSFQLWWMGFNCQKSDDRVDCVWKRVWLLIWSLIKSCGSFVVVYFFQYLKKNPNLPPSLTPVQGVFLLLRLQALRRNLGNGWQRDKRGRPSWAYNAGREPQWHWWLQH